MNVHATPAAPNTASSANTGIMHPGKCDGVARAVRQFARLEVDFVREALSRPPIRPHHPHQGATRDATRRVPGEYHTGQAANRWAVHAVRPRAGLKYAGGSLGCVILARK
jgi:hypothetical protein